MAALAWGAAELALARLDRFTAPFYPPTPSPGDAELFEAFEPHGYRLVPSRAIEHTYPPHGPGMRTVTVAANAHGFRGGGLDHPSEPRPRIVITGDSQVFGVGVEARERFTEALATRRPGWRIDNLGMPGYGADLMLRAVEHVAVPLHPRVVVICLYTDDWRRVRPAYAGMGRILGPRS
jgi:hypothetical protein